MVGTLYMNLLFLMACSYYQESRHLPEYNEYVGQHCTHSQVTSRYFKQKGSLVGGLVVVPIIFTTAPVLGSVMMVMLYFWLELVMLPVFRFRLPATEFLDQPNSSGPLVLDGDGGDPLYGTVGAWIDGDGNIGEDGIGCGAGVGVDRGGVCGIGICSAGIGGIGGGVGRGGVCDVVVFYGMLVLFWVLFVQVLVLMLFVFLMLVMPITMVLVLLVLLLMEIWLLLPIIVLLALLMLGMLALDPLVFIVTFVLFFTTAFVLLIVAFTYNPPAVVLLVLTAVLVFGLVLFVFVLVLVFLVFECRLVLVFVVVLVVVFVVVLVFVFVVVLVLMMVALSSDIWITLLVATGSQIGLLILIHISSKEFKIKPSLHLTQSLNWVYQAQGSFPTIPPTIVFRLSIEILEVGVVIGGAGFMEVFAAVWFCFASRGFKAPLVRF